MSNPHGEMQKKNNIIFELENVSVSFGGGKVLNDVDFEIRRGETLGVVGESGSGKSMFASSLLNAIVDPGQIRGTVTYHPEDGEPVVVTDMDEDELKDQLRWTELSFAVQSAQNAFNPTMTIEDHFIETFNAHDVDKKSSLEKARDVFRDVYLDADQVMPSYPGELSGGMKQRAFIALSVVLDPEVLVLDEPTASLDLLMQRAITTLLSDIKEKYDLTMVFVTHDLNLISLIADRLAVMYAFEMIEVGETEEIIKNATHPYTRMLLNSVPNISGPVDAMEGIPGKSPTPAEVPGGCRFHRRCPIADEQCVETEPPLDRVDGSHTAACFYPDRSREEVTMKAGVEDR